MHERVLKYLMERKQIYALSFVANKEIDEVESSSILFTSKSLSRLYQLEIFWAQAFAHDSSSLRRSC
jgi:hypothetical protein